MHLNIPNAAFPEKRCFSKQYGSAGREGEEEGEVRGLPPGELLLSSSAFWCEWMWRRVDAAFLRFYGVESGPVCFPYELGTGMFSDVISVLFYN